MTLNVCWPEKVILFKSFTCVVIARMDLISHRYKAINQKNFPDALSPNSSKTKPKNPCVIFIPILPKITYLASLFDSCTLLEEMVANAKRQYWRFEEKDI